MADPEIPRWLKSLPLAPEYRPTETEFADPIAFISRIEREASAFGICKVIPPFSKPSKKFVLSNLNRSLSKSLDLPSSSSSSSPVFTTRHQELGSRKTRPPVYKQQVWQSGELYTLDQFEAKSKSFARAHLGSVKEVNPFLVESLFWKAASEKPIYIEYANDVPGSGFAVPEEPFRYYSHRRKRKRGFEPKCPFPASSSEEREGTAGWKLSNSPWNLQVIARSPGSLTRFMPDEVPGVTSPMVYIGMLFSWFAWHVEDHELHSLNFLHMGSSKTWYAVPGEYASTLEEIVRVQGYGGNLDRLEAFTMLGEKTTLLSPEVFVASGVPCCRLVQNPGEFVVTFPRAYHVGFSHGFNCGEAANFATPQWLKVAKEAAVRRAAMNYLPMLSHQQLLYMLTMSFVSRVPRALLSGVRSSRLKDRKREEREILVKKTFLNDMMNENNLLCVLLAKESSSYAVLWEPDLLPNACTGSQTFSSSISLEAQGSVVDDDQGRELIQCKLKDRSSFEDKTDNCFVENSLHEVTANLTSDPCHNIPSVEKHKNACHADCMSSDMELLEILDADEGDLPFGWKIDSGTLACVACGILGYPFMAIVQPSEKASKELFLVNCEESHQNLGKSGCSNLPSCLPNTGYKFGPEETDNKLGEQGNPDSSCKLSPVQSGHVPLFEGTGARDGFKLLNNDVKELSNQFDELNPKIGNNKFFSRNYTKVDYSNGLHPCDGLKEHRGSMNMKTNAAVEIDISGTSFPGTKPFSEIDRLLGAPVETSSDEINKKWTTSNGFNRPRIFCLQHALEIEELLHCKGGAHVLIICHSDYLKIKAYATSIAEEVGMQFNFKDVPLENASLSDLNLINITIDDEHEEHGEDWTSKLGVNLRYCVQLRKQSTSKQERLTLALGRIFSDPFPLSAVSTLKWLSRKSRTPCKVVGTSLAKLHIDENMEKGEPTDRNLIADIATKVQVYRSLRREPSHMASKHCGRLSKGIPREFGSSNEGAMVDGRDDHKRTSSHTHHLNEKVEDDNCGGLFTVPISAAEKLQMHQESWLPLKVSTSDEVTDPESSECCHPYINIPVLESPEMRQERHSAEDFGTKCKVRSSEKSESQANILEQEAKNSEFQQETRALDEINSEHEVHNTVESGSEPTSQGAVHYSEDLQDTSAAQESNLEGSLVNSLLSVDQSPVPVLSYDKSEMQLEVSIAEEPKMEGNVENFSKSERVLVNNLLRVDSFGMQQEEIPAAEYNLQCEVGNLQLESQQSTIVPMVISSEVQQEIYSANETKTNDKLNYLKPVVDNSSVNSAHAIAVSMDESSGMQESVKDTLEGGGSYNGNINTVDIKQYVRRRNKRKREEEQIAEDHHFCNASFIRSPCEGLRPRTGRTATASEKADIRTVEKKKVVEKVTKRLDKDKCKESYECDIEGCCMSLKTRSELQLHKLNRCTHKGCGKRFRSHKHAMRHQRVHDNERPLKCPWKGCGMSFKWAWARTEHVRIHTGERPYKCTVAGCGLTFRFVSDFSRHRRKTGHSVNLTEQ